MRDQSPSRCSRVKVMANSHGVRGIKRYSQTKRPITETNAQKMALNKRASNNINENYPAANILGVLPPTEQPMSTKQTKSHPEADFYNFFPQNP